MKWGQDGDRGPAGAAGFWGPGLRTPLGKHSTLKIKAGARAGSLPHLPSQHLQGAHDIPPPFSWAQSHSDKQTFRQNVWLAKKSHKPQQSFRLAAL